MAHYIRVFSKSEAVPDIATLKLDLPLETVSITVEEGGESDWRQVLVAFSNGSGITLLERNPVFPGSLGAEEVEEFLDEVADAKPQSAAVWITDYLTATKCVYAFQILPGADEDDGWSIVYEIISNLRESVGGISQADNEGFSNESGFQILWQFSNSVKGPWWVAVLKENDWVTYQMNLGNRKHREAFWKGEIPKGVEPGEP
jgi:hypothetical protein